MDEIGLHCHECQFAQRYINPDDRIITKAFCRLGKTQVDEYGKCVIPQEYVESIYPRRLYGLPLEVVEKEEQSMSDAITLKREEVEKAGEEFRELEDSGNAMECFLSYERSLCRGAKRPICGFCKRLTLFAKGEEDECT